MGLCVHGPVSPGALGPWAYISGGKGFGLGWKRALRYFLIILSGEGVIKVGNISSSDVPSAPIRWNIYFRGPFLQEYMITKAEFKEENINCTDFDDSTFVRWCAQTTMLVYEHMMRLRIYIPETSAYF